jgi:putative ABC transport system permease protein
MPEVERAIPFYHNSGRWLNDKDGLARDVFVMGIKPGDPVFRIPEVARQAELLRQPDTILVDVNSRPEFGTLRVGRRLEIEQRNVGIVGLYNLGTGFVGLGVIITSDLNFTRMFPDQALTDINLGLLTLRPGADPVQTAAHLRRIMPADTQVFTRDELYNFETAHWITSTSTGLIFGFGVIVAVIVGLVILNQTLSTQISRQLAQYATLKAMGYTDLHLSGIVVILATIMTTISYVPAVLLSTGIYWVVRRATLLPIEMTVLRMLAVLAIAWGISTLSALLALRALRRADPVELF